MNQNSGSTSTDLEPGTLTLRQAADLLGSSTTALRKLIRQGRLLEAEKVRTDEGRMWAIPAASIPSIAEREGFNINLPDDPELPDTTAKDTTVVDLTSPGDEKVDHHGLDEHHDDEAEPAQEITEPATATTSASAATDLEPIGHEASVETETVEERMPTPTLAEVVDAAFLETLLGAKASERDALVVAERHRVEYDALAARQIELELRLGVTDDERRVLAERLHNETLARAIADARVTELRDQLQREITYAEAERYERRQSVAREAVAAVEAAEAKSLMGWRARRRLARRASNR